MKKEENMIIRKPLGELIADQLKKDIFNKKITFGERLIETDLAERFDVSRSSIREALRILEKEELVNSKTRKGTFISEFTDKDLEEIIELRLLLEPKAFKKALINMNEENREKLQEIIDRMEIEAENKNWNALFDLDTQFHHYVVNLCGNSRIIKIYESIHVQIRVYLAHLDQYYSNPMSFYQEHRELLSAFLQKDGELIESKVQDHINFVEETLLQKPFDK